MKAFYYWKWKSQEVAYLSHSLKCASIPSVLEQDLNLGLWKPNLERLPPNQTMYYHWIPPTECSCPITLYWQKYKVFYYQVKHLIVILIKKLLFWLPFFRSYLRCKTPLIFRKKSYSSPFWVPQSADYFPVAQVLLTKIFRKLHFNLMKTFVKFENLLYNRIQNNI
jgi:hypothetical protein